MLDKLLATRAQTRLCTLPGIRVGRTWLRYALGTSLIVGALGSLGPRIAYAQASDGTLPQGGSTSASQRLVTMPAAQMVSREQLNNDALVVHASTPQVIELQPLDENEAAPVVTAMAADQSGRYLAIAGDDHAVRIYSVELEKVIFTGKSHIDWIQALVFGLPDSDSDNHAPRLYSAGDDRVVYCWEQGAAPIPLLTFSSAIRSLSLNTEKNLLAVGGFEDDIVLFDLNRNEYVRRLKCDCGDQRTVSFSPDGSRLLCGGRDGEITVWDTDTGDQLAKYAAHRGRIHTASFSSTGEQITSVGEDNRLVQQDLAQFTDGQPTMAPIELKLPGKLMSMSLINDSVVAVAGADNSIQLFDFQTRRVVADLTSHEGTVAVLCPFRKMLASGSFDTTVRIWDLESIESKLEQTQQPVSFSPLNVDEKLRIR